MAEVKRIATIAAVAGAALVGGATPAASQSAESPPVPAPTNEVPSEQHCTILIATASGKNQGCSNTLGGGLVGTYYLHQGEGEDGQRLVMTCTIFGGIETPEDPNQSCHHTLLAGLIKGDA